jgi:hypothetical protein
MGNSTNNTTEFGALELGLEILHRERMTNTIVEGDSTLVINTTKRLQNGTRVGKVQTTLAPGTFPTKNPGASENSEYSGVALGPRSVNGLADRLANEGVGKEGLELDTTWINIPNGQLRTDCIQLATKDHEGSLSKEGHIEEGSARPSGRHAGPRLGYDCLTLDHQLPCRISINNRRGYDNKALSTVRVAGKARGKVQMENRMQRMT